MTISRAACFFVETAAISYDRAIILKKNYDSIAVIIDEALLVNQKKEGQYLTSSFDEETR